MRIIWNLDHFSPEESPYCCWKYNIILYRALYLQIPSMIVVAHSHPQCMAANTLTLVSEGARDLSEFFYVEYRLLSKLNRLYNLAHSHSLSGKWYSLASNV